MTGETSRTAKRFIYHTNFEKSSNPNDYSRPNQPMVEFLVKFEMYIDCLFFFVIENVKFH